MLLSTWATDWAVHVRDGGLVLSATRPDLQRCQGREYLHGLIEDCPTADRQAQNGAVAPVIADDDVAQLWMRIRHGTIDSAYSTTPMSYASTGPRLCSSGSHPAVAPKTICSRRWALVSLIRTSLTCENESQSSSRTPARGRRPTLDRRVSYVVTMWLEQFIAYWFVKNKPRNFACEISLTIHLGDNPQENANLGINI